MPARAWSRAFSFLVMTLLAAVGFYSAAAALLLKSPFLRGAAWPGAATQLRLDPCPHDHFPQPREYFLTIGLLRALRFGYEMNFIELREPAAGKPAQPVLSAGGQPEDLLDDDPQFGACVELVNVLPAGSAAARKLHAQRPRRRDDAGCKLRSTCR